jgi:antitoxin PrlF
MVRSHGAFYITPVIRYDSPMMQHQTKLTSQSQVSVPAAIRHALGIKPGSLIEWTLQGDHIIVKRAVRFSTQDIHNAAFDDLPTGKPRPKSLAELKQGIQAHMKRRYARD